MVSLVCGLLLAGDPVAPIGDDLLSPDDSPPVEMPAGDDTTVDADAAGERPSSVADDPHPELVGPDHGDPEWTSSEWPWLAPQSSALPVPMLELRLRKTVDHDRTGRSDAREELWVLLVVRY